MMNERVQNVRLLEQSPAVPGQFSECVENTDWHDVTRCHQEKTEHDVLRALSKNKLDVEDFAALISPAAEPYLFDMVAKSEQLTLQRFGNSKCSNCTPSQRTLSSGQNWHPNLNASMTYSADFQYFKTGPSA